MMGTKTTRRDKIGWMTWNIEQYFNAHPKGSIDKGKLLAEFALKNFSTARTGEEILKLFEQVGSIKINGEEITK